MLTTGPRRGRSAAGRRTRAGAAAAAVAVGALGACQPVTAEDPPPAVVLTTDEVAWRYGYDADGSQLTPVYAIVPQFRDPQDGYARDLLAARCLKGTVEYQVTPPDSGDSMLDPRTGQRRFDTDSAARFGYAHLRGTAAAGREAVPADVEITDALGAEMVRCGEEADERLGSPPERLLNDIEATGWAAVDGDAAVQEALTAWRTCMAPLGIVDLPDDPNEMPPPSVTGTRDESTTDSANGLPLTEREREVAVADAACHESSGLNRATHAARATAELRMIGQNLDAFDAVRAEYEEYDAGVDRVVAELG